MADASRRPRGIVRVPVTEASEVAASLEFTRRLGQIEPLLKRYATIAQIRAKPNSELGDDDRRTSWLNLSHFVGAAMGMATDNLDGLKQLLLPDGENLVHRITAHFPIMRSALESAGTALWLLRPDDQRERIVRLLQLRTTDIDYHLQLAKAAAALVDDTTREGRSMAQDAIRKATRRRKKHLEHIAHIANAEGIDAVEYREGAPGYGRIIEEATEYPDHSGGLASTTWRLISGLTHPSPLRVIDTGQHDEPVENVDGTLYVLTSMHLGYSTAALLSAMLTYRQATEALAARIARVHTRP